MKRVVFFDTETGGLTDQHPTIQIAAVATEALREVASFEAKIEFTEGLADPEALKLNHYDPEVWEREAKPEHVVLRDFSGFLSEHATVEMVSKRTGRTYKIARLAGHNVVSFDAPRLSAAYKRLGLFLPAEAYRPLDTLQLALWCSIRSDIGAASMKLGDLCEAFDIKTEGAHDALSDVRMSVALARRLMDRIAGLGPR